MILPAYTVPKELDDVRTADVLQSYVDLGHPATQQEAAENARRPGYSSGRGTDILFGHGRLVPEMSEAGTVGRRVTPVGMQWLNDRGRAALPAWLQL